MAEVSEFLLDAAELDFAVSLTDQEIADKVGVTRQAIHDWRMRYKLPLISIKIKDNRLELYKQGLGDKEIEEIIRLT